MTPVYYALLANISFALAIIFYTSLSKEVSVLWTNAFKAAFAFVAFLLTITLLLGWNPISLKSLGVFLFSGAIGLAIGDLFLLKAFTLIGPARTMILFGFQPLILGAVAYFFFDQDLPINRLIAVLFLIACLIVFSLEQYRTSKEWGFKGILFAFMGMTLDAGGILLTRYAFDESPELHAFEGNFYRCLGALAGFFVLHYSYARIQLFKRFQNLSHKNKILILLSSLLGTYLSLGFYLEAVRVGHLASISAIAITGPFFAAFFESLYHKKWPTKYFAFAFALFLVGFYFLNT